MGKESINQVKTRLEAHVSYLSICTEHDVGLLSFKGLPFWV